MVSGEVLWSAVSVGLEICDTVKTQELLMLGIVEVLRKITQELGELGIQKGVGISSPPEIPLL